MYIDGVFRRGATIRSSKTRKRDVIDDVIAAKVTARRRAQGVSQSTLAEKIGVSFQQVQKYETGENRIAASRLLRIARALESKITDFIPDEDK